MNSRKSARRAAARNTGSACFEGLENRNLFAGNVTVILEPPAVLNGPATLRLTGDNGSNAVEVQVDGTSGEALITGSNGTTITFDGVTASSAFVEGAFVPNLIADLGNGNDEITLLGNTYTDIAVQTGNGNDAVVTDGTSQIGGNLDIDTGNGSDSVRLRLMQSTPNRHWTIDTGNGDDTVTLYDVAFILGSANDPFHMLLGNGNDTLEIIGAVAIENDADVLFDGGNGTDTVVNKNLLVVVPAPPPLHPVFTGFEIELP